MMTKKSGIDWKEIHRRLEAGKKSIELAFKPNAARSRRILLDRAKAYAARVDMREPDREYRKTSLCFSAFEETFALDLKDMKAIVPLSEYTPLPAAAMGIRGILPAYDAIWSLVDVGALLGLRDSRSTPDKYALLLKHEEYCIALRVGGDVTLQQWNDSDLATAGEEGGSLSSDIIRGVLPGNISLLDIRGIFRQLTIGEVC